MPNFRLVAISNPVAGREEECGRWYDETHLHDMTQVPGVLSAQRFVLLRCVPSKAFKQYLAVYEIEAADEHDARNLITRLNATKLPLSDALDVPSVNLAIYRVGAAPTFADSPPRKDA